MFTHLNTSHLFDFASRKIYSRERFQIIKPQTCQTGRDEALSTHLKYCSYLPLDYAIVLVNCQFMKMLNLINHILDD